ncbi:MAG: hypothetical protein MUO88_10625, partial [Desulfobacterales bacterium]|nr:hypothetical protein [Desulfobacterales bacterium]
MKIELFFYNNTIVSYANLEIKCAKLKYYCYSSTHYVYHSIMNLDVKIPHLLKEGTTRKYEAFRAVAKDA